MTDAVKLLHRVPMPTRHPVSIARDERGIWVADVETSDLLLLNPANGAMITQRKAVVNRPQTISRDDGFMWEMDEETSRLYRRRIDGDETQLYGVVEGVNTPYLGIAGLKGEIWILGPDQPFFTVHNNVVAHVKFPRRILSETFEAPSYSCRGLCHDGTYLWTLDVDRKQIFAMDPATGIILTSYYLPGCGQPSSLVVTEDRVWTMDIKENALLTYNLDRTVPYSTWGGRRSHVEIVKTIRNTGPGSLKRMELWEGLPQDYLHQRLHSEVRCDPPPREKVPCLWDDKRGEIAWHEIADLGPCDEQQVTMAFDVDTVNLEYHLFPHRSGSIREIPEDVRKRYLFSELGKSSDPEIVDVVDRAQSLLQTEHPEIQDRVASILNGEENAFWVARKLFNWVVEEVKYQLPYASISARKILEAGKGSCGNHATIYVALCQAAGLPARSLVGYGVWKDDARLGYLDHEISEVYIPNYGWVPVDTSRFMALPVYGTHPLTKFLSFGTLSERFFVNGFGRDLTSEFAKRKHRSERVIEVNGVLRVIDRFFIRWDSEPLEDD